MTAPVLYWLYLTYWASVEVVFKQGDSGVARLVCKFVVALVKMLFILENSNVDVW